MAHDAATRCAVRIHSRDGEKLARRDASHIRVRMCAYFRRRRRRYYRDYSWPLHGLPPARCAPITESRIVAAGEQLVIVDKPADVAMDGQSTVTLDKLVTKWFGPVKWCHRLDYGTSGIVVGALTRSAARSVCESVREKSYLGVVKGHFSGSYTIAKPIGARGFLMQVGIGKKSTTQVTALVKCWYRKWPVTKVLLTPVTGRRHQLRVHLASVGYPLVGDATYDDSALAAAPRMCLHAYRLVVHGLLTAQSHDPFPIVNGNLKPQVSFPISRCHAHITPR